MEKKDEEVRQGMLELQMIEEKLKSLIESYTLEIEDETKNLKKYKDALYNSRICTLIFQQNYHRTRTVTCYVSVNVA